MTEHASDVTRLRPTPELDRVLDLLSGLDQRPVADHAQVYAEVHDELRRTLESAPG